MVVSAFAPTWHQNPGWHVWSLVHVLGRPVRWSIAGRPELHAFSYTETLCCHNIRNISYKIYKVMNVSHNRNEEFYHYPVKSISVLNVNNKMCIYLDKRLRNQLLRGSCCCFPSCPCTASVCRFGSGCRSSSALSNTSPDPSNTAAGTSFEVLELRK